MTYLASRKLTALSGALALGVSALATTAPAALADEIAIEANVALVSDYRFRGVSLSDKDPAIQGGFDLVLPSGFYVGTWASSIEPVGSSELELDLYAGYGFEALGAAFDIGVLVYTYPGASDTHYWEVYGAVDFETGLVASTVGFAYAPEQDNIGSEDNLYLYYEGSVPLGDSGFSLVGGLGYETGAFGDLDGDGDDKWNWRLGVGWSLAGVDLELAYIDTSEDTSGSNATAVFTISKAF